MMCSCLSPNGNTRGMSDFERYYEFDAFRGPNTVPDDERLND